MKWFLMAVFSAAAAAALATLPAPARADGVKLVDPAPWLDELPEPSYMMLAQNCPPIPLFLDNPNAAATTCRCSGYGTTRAGVTYYGAVQFDMTCPDDVTRDVVHLWVQTATDDWQYLYYDTPATFAGPGGADGATYSLPWWKGSATPTGNVGAKIVPYPAWNAFQPPPPLLPKGVVLPPDSGKM